MSDHQPPKSDDLPELELARPLRSSPSSPPAGSTSSSASGLRPVSSSSGLHAVRTASREVPIAPEPKKAMTKERLKDGAVDTLLNSVSILGEVIEDFKNSDKFFKYKALVLSTWFLMVVGAFGVACPSSGPSNDIDAHLVVSGDAASPIYMVQNESKEPWKDVEILVNGGAYRSTMSEMAPEGGSATLSPAVLYDAQGKKAPSNLVITEIVVKVLDPDAEVTLLSGGQPTAR